MVSENLSRRTTRWVTAVVLAVSVVGGVAGCSNGSDSGASKKPTAGASTAAPTQQSSGAPASQPSGTRPASAQEAVSAFLTAVIKGQPKDACLVMAQPADGSTPAQVGSPELCNSNDPAVQEMQKNLSSMGESFKPKNMTGDPKIEVADVPSTGDKVVIPADRIAVNGQSLTNVVLSNSTGVSEGQVDVKVESSKISDAWWVTNLEFNVG